jgi:hypothetical protein
MRQGLWITALTLATACGREPPAGATPPPAKAAVGPPAAAQALADTFSPDVVGTLIPAAPRAGDYAMQLTLSFEAFPTTELRISDRRQGVVRLTLAADGTARACLAGRSDNTSQGQWHYERDPARRQHHADSQVQLLALRGTWRVDDGVAAIRFDHLASSACDGSAPERTPDAPTELRCVAVATSNRIPVGSLACVANERSQLLDLGMPMTRASRRADGPFAMSAPSGTELLLGAPGLSVDVEQDAHATLPTFKVASAAVTLDEAAYRPPPPPRKP